MTDDEKRLLFKQMAIRNLDKRDKIYFFDFYKSVMSLSSEIYEFDITRMRYPIHNIMDEIKYFVIDLSSTIRDTATRGNEDHDDDNVSDKNNINNDKIQEEVDLHDEHIHHLAMESIESIQNNLDNLWNLYYFCVGARLLCERNKLNNNVMFTLIDTLNIIKTAKHRCKNSSQFTNVLSMFTCFLHKFLDDIIKQPSFANRCHTLLGKL